MRFLEELRSEHERIEQVALSLRTFANAETRSDGEARQYAFFFRTYAGAWHHEREEEVLVPALTRELALPAERGPIAVLLGDHARMSTLLGEMETNRDGFRAAALAYTEQLLAHIDMENFVFLPESEDRLRRAAITDLASRNMTAAERAAAAVGEALLRHHPPAPCDVLRGQGCVMCPSFHVTCSGIEAEWWNEYEWAALETE